MDHIYHIKEYHLPYIKAATTSRGSLNNRRVWLIDVYHKHQLFQKGTGECGIIPGLSPEDHEDFEADLYKVIEQLNNGLGHDEVFLERYPALRFALETALIDLKNGGKQLLFDSAYCRGEAGIPINGLVWMGDIEEMEKEAIHKIQSGFDCIKLKIGAKDFDKECALIHSIRKRYDAGSLMIRLDANEAFHVSDALYQIKQLASLGIHSIEQPIPRRMWDHMHDICTSSPIPIALDEELIGLNPYERGAELIEHLQPQYLILKPSFTGGLKRCDQWIQLCEKHRIGWWATSALESNVGLNAIAQWVSTKQNHLHQGLGTGQLYRHNFQPVTSISDGHLWLCEQEEQK
jgi:o-succinylbenzoate synthase